MASAGKTGPATSVALGLSAADIFNETGSASEVGEAIESTEVGRDLRLDRVRLPGGGMCTDAASPSKLACRGKPDWPCMLN